MSSQNGVVSSLNRMYTRFSLLSIKAALMILSERNSDVEIAEECAQGTDSYVSTLLSCFIVRTIANTVIRFWWQKTSVNIARRNGSWQVHLRQL